MDDKELKEDGWIMLDQEPFPSTVHNITSFLTTTAKEQNKQTILTSNHKDRRNKCNELWMHISKDNDKLDVAKYILQLTMKFGEDTFYVGTGTIISIVQNTLYVLTCAHNVITFHPFRNDKYSAKNIWLKFQGKDISATKCYVYPGYCKRSKLGNDIALIQCKIRKPFMFYQIFPILKSLQNSDFYKDTEESDWKKKINVDVASVSMWLVKNVTTAAYKAIVKTTDHENNDGKQSTKRGFNGEIYGYPAEKNGEFWGMKGDVFALDKPCLVSYNIDTTGGQSGAPILVDSEIVGIHTNGDYLGVEENYGSMLTQERIQWIYDLIPCQVGLHPKYYRNKK